MKQIISNLNKFRIHVVIAYILSSYLFVDIYGRNELFPIFMLVSFWMICTGSYFINRYTDFESDKINEPEYANKTNLTLLVGIYLFLLALCILQWYKLPILPAIIMIILGVSYSIKIPKLKKIKDVLFLKNIYAAFAWYMSWIILVSYTDWDISYLLYTLKNSFSWFLLVLFYEVLWDLRDISGDLKNKTTTIATNFGFGFSKKLCIFLITIISFNTFIYTENIYYTLLYFPLFVLVFFLKESTKNYYYHSFIYVQIFILIVLTLIK